MPETGEKTADLQLTFEDEFARLRREAERKEQVVLDEAEQQRISAIVLPSAAELLQDTRGVANLTQRIMGIGGRAVVQGKSVEEVGKWAQEISRELGLNGKQ